MKNERTSTNFRTCFRTEKALNLFIPAVTGTGLFFFKICLIGSGSFTWTANFLCSSCDVNIYVEYFGEEEKGNIRRSICYWRLTVASPRFGFLFKRFGNNISFDLYSFNLWTFTCNDSTDLLRLRWSIAIPMDRANFGFKPALYNENIIQIQVITAKTMSKKWQLITSVTSYACKCLYPIHLQLFESETSSSSYFRMISYRWTMNYRTKWSCSWSRSDCSCLFDALFMPSQLTSRLIKPRLDVLLPIFVEMAVRNHVITFRSHVAASSKE